MEIGRLGEIIGEEIEMFRDGLSSISRLNALSNAARVMIACEILELSYGPLLKDGRKVKLLK